MATAYNLELTDDALPLDRLAEAVRATASRLNLLDHVSEHPEPASRDVVLTSGLLVTVSPAWVSDTDPFVVDFVMARAAEVTFYFIGDDPDRQFDELLRLVLGLLEEVAGDAVLHYEYTVAWLVRRDGQLVLNEDHVWPQEMLARLPVPYQRSPLQIFV
jgi:hypothetical protein